MPAPLLAPFMLWLALHPGFAQDGSDVSPPDPPRPATASPPPAEAEQAPPGADVPLADAVAEDEEPEGAPARDGPEPTGPTASLDAGLQALEDLDLFAANDKLTEALSAGPYTRAQVVSLYAALGITRAYLEDEDGALEAFAHLLSVDPGHSLAYTTSPKATFLFERMREQTKAQRSAELRLDPPAVVPFGAPVKIVLERPADPTRLFTRVDVLVRVKGEKDFRQTAAALPPVGGASVVEVGTWEEEAGFTDDNGQVGLIVEVALVAYDRHGWEVYQRPSQDRPLEIPVGFDAPGPWFTHWWIWALGGAGAAATAAAVATVSSAGVAAWLLWPEPTTVPLTTSINGVVRGPTGETP